MPTSRDSDLLPVLRPLRSFTPSALARAELEGLPPIVVAAGRAAMRRVVEFFAVTIRNGNTRRAYAHAIGRFLDFATVLGVPSLASIQPLHVAAYIEHHSGSAPTRKLHLAAISSFCDWLVTGHVLEHSPAASVRGPRHVVEHGKTPVLSGEQVRQLFDSIPGEDLRSLRDRALLSVLFFAGSRISAALRLAPRDLFRHGRDPHIRLNDKGGKVRDLPLHHEARECLERYIAAAELAQQPAAPIFRVIGRNGQLTDRPLVPSDAWAMIQRRRRRAGVDAHASCHTFRASAITEYLRRGGSLEMAQLFAGHSDARTTRLYDHSGRRLPAAEVERIQI
jgi:site-specific recombinase XerD